MPVSLLQKLISIPSVYGNEKEIADFVENFIKEKNSELSVIRENNTIIAYTHFESKKKTIALVGHLDTVPGENDYTGQIIDGKLYGLGTSDMKAGDAVMLKLIEDFAFKSSRYNLFFIFYEKEEGPYLDNGLRQIFDKYLDLLKKIDFAFVLEPTDNVVQVGCLGVIHAWFKFKGKRAHSARPWEGNNAIHKSWRLLKFLDELEPVEYKVGKLSYFEVLNATMTEFKGGRNIIPEEFKVNLNYRFSPTKTLEEAKDDLVRIKEQVEADEIEFTDLSPAARPCIDNPILVEFLKRFNLPIEPKQAWTDVAQFSYHGIDAVNFGPGQPHQAHQKNEYVEIEKVKECYEILSNFLKG
ncbi:succinyl-diaminopimelate desuccinylase [Desulfurobacterium thermolithotrophum]|uniref:succinyl-diaminopimelate desuccinylase n=1 Tax=Desulfurobacterium thermolithotrophum TaxID=64160 RepID=UPI0013D34878|nr:succinyl-diaminopimelate desuccinylase [Desulfurobacterium thermolithotrophum]